MSGIKGMKWQKRNGNPYSVNTSINNQNMTALMDMAEKRKWSISQCLRQIINFYFENEEKIELMVNEMYRENIRNNWRQQ